MRPPVLRQSRSDLRLRYFWGTGLFRVLSGPKRCASRGTGFSLGAVFLSLFLAVIVSVTTRNCPAGFAPIAIGLSLTLFHLIAIPISNASLNRARSTATALFGGSEALGSLWLFWVAPIFGGVVGGIIGRWLHQE